MPAYHIVVDLSSRTLFLYSDSQVVKTYTVGVGAMLTRSPLGSFHVINKVPNPGGPFGVYWLGLSKPHYGIHGTNNPSSIGKMVSHGCIRMYNADVAQLANIIPIGTSVEIRQ